MALVVSLSITVVSNDMRGFIINFNSKMKEKINEAISGSDLFVVSLVRMYLGVVGWEDCEVSFGKNELLFILGEF